MKAALVGTLAQLRKLPVDELLAQRRQRLANYGVFREM